MLFRLKKTNKKANNSVVKFELELKEHFKSVK